MTTTVVNLRHAEFDVYIGRAGRGYEGYFGNPVVVGRRCQECGETHFSSGETLVCYRRYFERRVTTDPVFRARVLDLTGRRLGCFCKPKPCHGDVIVEWLRAQ